MGGYSPQLFRTPLFRGHQNSNSLNISTRTKYCPLHTSTIAQFLSTIRVFTFHKLHPLLRISSYEKTSRMDKEPHEATGEGFYTMINAERLTTLGIPAPPTRPESKRWKLQSGRRENGSADHNIFTPPNENDGRRKDGSTLSLFGRVGEVSTRAQHTGRNVEVFDLRMPIQASDKRIDKIYGGGAVAIILTKCWRTPQKNPEAEREKQQEETLAANPFLIVNRPYTRFHHHHTRLRPHARRPVPRAPPEFSLAELTLA